MIQQGVVALQFLISPISAAGHRFDPGRRLIFLSSPADLKYVYNSKMKELVRMESPDDDC